jgi:hypothetical protein
MRTFLQRILLPLLLVILVVVGVSIGGVTLANNWENITAGQELFTRDQVDRAWSEGWADANAQTLQTFWELNQRVQDLERQYAETTTRLRAEIQALNQEVFRAQAMNELYRENLSDFFNQFASLLPQQNLNQFLLDFYNFAYTDLVAQLAQQQANLQTMRTVEELNNAIQDALFLISNAEQRIVEHGVLNLIFYVWGNTPTSVVVRMPEWHGPYWPAANIAINFRSAAVYYYENSITCSSPISSITWRGTVFYLFDEFDTFKLVDGWYYVREYSSAYFFSMLSRYTRYEIREEYLYHRNTITRQNALITQILSEIPLSAILEHEIARTEAQLTHVRSRITALT